MPRLFSNNILLGVASIAALLGLSFPGRSPAQESICAEVKIEIDQKVSLERQACEAVLKIHNGLDGIPVEAVDVDLALRNCVRDKCRTLTVERDHCPPYKCSQPNGTSVSIGIPNGASDGQGVKVCLNASAPNTGSWWGDVAVHEFAHLCGWNHGDGKGVPSDPGQPGNGVPDTSHCNPVL
jgi:hypothetical protein